MQLVKRIACEMDSQKLRYCIRQKKEIYSFLDSDQTKFRTNRASYLMDTGGSFPGMGGGVKESGREADNLDQPPSNSEITDGWVNTSSLPHPFMVGY